MLSTLIIAKADTVKVDSVNSCEYKFEPLEDAVAPFILSALFPPTCLLYSWVRYDLHKECKDVAYKKATNAFSFGAFGALTSISALTILMGGQDIAILGCASVAIPELRLNCVSGEPSCGSSGTSTSCGDCSGGSSGTSTSCGDCSGGSSGTSTSCGDCSGGSSSTTTTCMTSPKIPTPIPRYVKAYIFRYDLCAYTGKGCK
ncbi:MAG: hypothetical protein ABIL16_08125 [candidate division WOR-3 bacterium]